MSAATDNLASAVDANTQAVLDATAEIKDLAAQVAAASGGDSDTINALAARITASASALETAVQAAKNPTPPTPAAGSGG